MKDWYTVVIASWQIAYEIKLLRYKYSKNDKYSSVSQVLRAYTTYMNSSARHEFRKCLSTSTIMPLTHTVDQDIHLEVTRQKKKILIIRFHGI